MRADVDKFCSHSGDARYDELDANKDGKLHESEVRRMHALLLTILGTKVEYCCVVLVRKCICKKQHLGPGSVAEYGRQDVFTKNQA